MINANTITASPAPLHGWQGTRRPAFSRGDILTAVITDINNGIFSLQSREGLGFTADASVVSGSVGDEISFEILEGRMDNGRPNLVLKQLRTQQGAQLETVRRVQSTKELFRANGLAADTDPSVSEQDEQLERMRAVAAIRRQVAQGRSVGSQIIGTLSAMGLSIDKISFGMLSGIINDMGIHNARMVADAQAQAAVSAYQVRGGGQYSAQTEVLQALARYGVPLTDENIQSAVNALEMLATSGGITAYGKAYLLREGAELTAANIYSARALASSGAAALTAHELAALSGAIDDFFAHLGIENTPENKSLAQFMLRHSLDITPQNMQRLAFLNHLQNASARADVLDAMALGMSIGKDPPAVPLDAAKPSPDAPELLEHYKTLIANYPDVSHISDEHLGTALSAVQSKGKTTTLAAVQQVAASFAHGSYHLLDGLPVSETSKIDIPATRITLEEIRLKLSYEAARVLAAKGIHIDTAPLGEALENVKQARREALQSNFTVFAHRPSEDELSLLERTGEALRIIRPTGPTTLAHLALLRGRRDSTINAVLASVNHERAKSGYDEFMTAVKPQLGDSFAKVRGQFAPLLEGLGVQPTAHNIAAAEILSKNNIPVTPEKIEHVRLAEYEVSYVAERLHPVIAASIIREGLNPLEMAIRDVIAYIDRFNGAYGVSDADRIAAYIAQMDRDKSLSAQEREKLVAFYRVLSRVTRDGAAALGAFCKSGHEPTLGNMLSAAEYYRRTGGGDRSFMSRHSDQGLLEDIVHGGSTIRSALQSAAPVRDSASFAARELVPQLPPKNLAELLARAEQANSLDDTLSQVKDGTPKDVTAQDSALKHAQEQAEARFAQMFSAQPKLINWLQQHGIAATPTTMAAMSALVADQHYIGNELDKVRRRLHDAVNKPDSSGAARANNASTEAAATLETALDNSKIDDIAAYSPGAMSTALEPFNELSLLRGAIRIKSAAANLQSGADYTFPVKLHDRIASLNMYVMNSRGLSGPGESRALLALNTGNLGNVMAYVTAEEGRVTIEISGSDPDALRTLEAHAEGLAPLLSAALEQAGFAAHELSVSFSHEQRVSYPSLEEDMSPRVNLPGYSTGWRA
ncbi:MAG: flagellar hook-length control protein FliK [Defluviitaleaceae bacterium]|nr:flagellar hook-length control protein FliK [Defluviitaleaceae bacterium]